MQGFGAFVSEKASVPEVRSKLKSIREFLSALVVSVQRGRPAGLLFILCCICICISLLQVFFKDDRVRVEKLIPAGALCASQVPPPPPARARRRLPVLAARSHASAAAAWPC